MNVNKRFIIMKASEIISILAKNIAKYGDKPVLVTQENNGVWNELMISNAGDIYKVKLRNRGSLHYLLFDIDLI